jgi:translation elongation factor EF-4
VAQLLLFDCFYDEFRGVICLVQVVQGQLIKGERVTSHATGKSYEVLDVSHMRTHTRASGSAGIPAPYTPCCMVAFAAWRPVQADD